MTDDAGRAAYDPAVRSRGLIASALWAIVCLLLFVWWASHYSSLVELLGEWQFAAFGRYFPSLTVVLAVVLLAAPLALIVLLRRRHDLKRAQSHGMISPRERMLVAASAARRGRIFFTFAAAVAGLAAFAAAISLLTLPEAAGRMTIVRTDEAPGAFGPARFGGGRRFGAVARLEENVGLARRVTYIAPVRFGREPSPARFFSQMERLAGADPRFAPIPDGILQADGVPRELVNLYRANGTRVADRPFLLVQDATWLRWRPLVLAAQLAIVALLASGAAILLQRQTRRLERAITAPAERA